MFKNRYLLLMKCLMVFPLIIILDLFGAFTHLFELSFERNFYYPLVKDNIYADPYPNAAFKYKFLNTPKLRTTPADVTPRLTLLVKSDIGHAERRKAIRRTWGYEQRFSDVHIKRVFLLGTTGDTDAMENIAQEAKQYDDIVQANFKDTYFNNTLKTMTGIRWASEYFNNSDYYMYVDDDYYVSIKNVLRFLGRDQTQHSVTETTNDNNLLFAGYVFQSSPLRHKFSKWYISLQEYPFDNWPPYVTAGAFILSRDALLKMHAVSRNLPLFRFDDIYLGFVALKADIRLQHCTEFYFNRPRYYGPDSFSNVVASHGFDDPTEMEKLWNECRSANYA